MVTGPLALAARLFGWIKRRVAQPIELPPVGPNDVKIKMKAVGLCLESDVDYLKHMRCADFHDTEPIVIGQECAGVVSEIGSSVKHLKVGDRVAIETVIACGRCKDCKEGYYNLCPEPKFFVAPPANGSFATQIVHPADLCFKLPENESLYEGDLHEPNLKVAVHAAFLCGAGPDTTVMVIGAGPIGLVTMEVAQGFGAPKVIVVDVDEQRLAVAKEMGADATVHVSFNMKDLDEEVLKVQEAMGAKIDIAIDTVLVEKTMMTALKATHESGGSVCFIGSPNKRNESAS